MIGPGAGARVMVATRPVDFRKGADSLAALVGAAGRDDRAAFDWLSAEMLGGDAREMLFVALGNFLRARAPRRAPKD